MQAIIYDLDDTLYPTHALSRIPFQPFFSHFHHWSSAYITNEQFQEVVKLLWTRPIDEVLRKFPLPLEKIGESLKILQEIQIDASDITATSGVNLIPTFCNNNILVTSGIPALQWAKVRALAVGDYFKEIIVDNPLLPGAGKQPLFARLIKKYHWDPKFIAVVGDNPDTELQAGHNLGMKIIQIKKSGTDKSPLADAYINDFHDLKQVLKQVRLKGR